MLLKISRDAVLSKPRSVCIQAHAGQFTVTLPQWPHLVWKGSREEPHRASAAGYSSPCYRSAHWALQRPAPLVKEEKVLECEPGLLPSLGPKPPHVYECPWASVLMVRRPQRERLVRGRMSWGRDCVASPVLSSGMFTKHPCLGTRSGPISIPGSLQTQGPGAEGQSCPPQSQAPRAPTPQSYSTGAWVSALYLTLSQSLPGAPVRCWGCGRGSGLAEIPRKNHNCSGPSTHRNQGQAKESAKPASASAHREGLA